MDKRETLRVRDLFVQFQTRGGTVRAVDGVSFSLRQGERLGLVGESGSGKSTIALALLRMIKPPGRIVSGSIILDGDTDITKIPEAEMPAIRFSRVAMIPQGAMNSLNPVRRIRDQFIDSMRAHGIRENDKQTKLRIEGLLQSVGLRGDVAKKYPHELSGGMKQRVCIAMAVSLKPSVIIADEPTSALDVIVQRQIMETLGRVQEEIGASVLLIGHDMGLMAQFVDRLGVMYGGKLVEDGERYDTFKEPLHPYTKVLIESLPTFDRDAKLVKIPGQPHSPLAPPPGCVFHPRCPSRMENCSSVVPELLEYRAGRKVACLLYEPTKIGAGAKEDER
jgi:oligopeptide/dipeptide ABC transporter ATP-binding protein